MSKKNGAVAIMNGQTIHQRNNTTSVAGANNRHAAIILRVLQTAVLMAKYIILQRRDKVSLLFNLRREGFT